METIAKETVILVAHGSERSGSFSNPNIVIITKAKKPLSFAEAKEYLGGKAFPEFKSSSLGEFAGLSDGDCLALFGKAVGAGPGLVDTGEKRKGGTRILALRGVEWSFAELGVMAKAYKVILVACRN